MTSYQDQTHDNSDPHDIIPTSFNMHNTLYEKYYNIETKERYVVQMCWQTKSNRIKLLEGHGVKKTFLQIYYLKNRK